MLKVLLFLTCVSFIFIVGGFILLAKQHKEIKNITKILNDKRDATGNSLPIKFDLGALNNLIVSGLTKSDNPSNDDQESKKINK